MTDFRLYRYATGLLVTLRAQRSWDQVLDYVAREDERKIGGPKLPPKKS
jgi:hypothetical protein